MTVASEIRPLPQGRRGSRATHQTTEAYPHTRGHGGGVRAAGLPGPSHWGPRQRGRPLALRAADPPFGAAGNWQTSCTPALRLSWSRRPGSPAGNNTASSLLPFRGRPAALSPGSRAPRSAQSRRAGRAPPSRPGAGRRRGQAGCAAQRVLGPGLLLPRAAGPPTATRSRRARARPVQRGPPRRAPSHRPLERASASPRRPLLGQVPTPGSAARMGREISGRALPIGPGEMWAGKSLGELCRLGGRSGRRRGEPC